jgi:shikimate dehydrogenase
VSGFREPRIAGLIGWPVAQSKSPIIHRFWLDRLGIDGEYARYPVRPGEAGAALKAMVPLGLAGLQATMPHKRDCFAAVDILTDAAHMLGAVNTVTVMEDGKLRGHNTDMAGFLEPLQNIDLAGSSVTILGAGGAAAAIAVGLASKAPARINLVNRSADGLDRLLADIGPALEGIEIVCGTWADAAKFLAESRLVTNATLLGMAGQPDCPVDVADMADGATVYDIITHPRETKLLKAAAARGLTVFDGMHMLLGQAREAFELFYGACPPQDADAELRALLVR